MFSAITKPVSLLLFAIVFAAYSTLAGAASVWQVSKDGRHFYLAGTVHLLSKTDYPLPAAYDIAYRNSEHLVFETDMALLTSPAGIEQLLQQNTYPPGGDLQQDLSANVYQQLVSYSQTRQLPLAAVTRFKPAFASMMLVTLELQKLGAAEEGVDAFYLKKAQQDNKTMSGLESLNQHLGIIDALNQLDADNIMLSTLQDMSKLETQLGDMKTAWRNGDPKQLEQLFITDLKAFPEFYDILLLKRNHAWLPQLEALLQQEKVSLVMVGALHLAGADGLLHQLEKRGYTLTPVSDTH
ncbi:TraB/GumN family protein [Chromatiaceae bacterium AAb-1]|nr:TraB/GumN family protein [Chromatiaceae bacterium AAb-1]